MPYKLNVYPLFVMISVLFPAGYGALAQLVEQRPEEPCVPSSSLGGATIGKYKQKEGEEPSFCIKDEYSWRVINQELPV